MKRLMTLGGFLCSMVLVGCGSNLPSTVPVTGTVTLDGKPVEGASVSFLSSENVVATGITDASGKYSLKTIVGEQMAEGAVPGTHSIGVAKSTGQGVDAATTPEEMKAMTTQMMTTPTNAPEFKQTHIIPQKYNNPMMSNLKAEVTQGGTNEVNLELTSR